MGYCGFGVSHLALQMGIGIGGDYPLSAIITSEFAPVHIRGRLMAIVFSSQGLGQLCTCLRTHP